MTPSTKHGGIIPLTFERYDTIRRADAASVVDADLGAVDVAAGASAADVTGALPASAEVTLAYQRGTASRSIDWDVSAVDTGVAGTYPVTGVVQTVGANLNQWVGAGGSTAWNAPNRTLYSSTALTVTAQVVVAPAPLPLTVTAVTRCVAGKVVLAVTGTNEGSAPVALTLTTPYGAKSIPALQPGKSSSSAFTTRLASIPAGSVAATVSAGGVSVETSAAYAAASCG